MNNITATEENLLREKFSTSFSTESFAITGEPIQKTVPNILYVVDIIWLPIY